MIKQKNPDIALNVWIFQFVKKLLICKHEIKELYFQYSLALIAQFFEHQSHLYSQLTSPSLVSIC
jgi:hypothetical protein